uniref:3D domain-containing protein n=1 Tax=Planococcus sp. CAU13 TaxID=1541197 RepID=UPI000530011E
TSAPAPSAQSGKEMQVSATAYTAYCAGCSGITATGIDLRTNPNQKVIAVDPTVIPLGSTVWVEGYGTAIAGDTGGAIKGNKIDVFIPSRDAALQWGRKTVTIKILK